MRLNTVPDEWTEKHEKEALFQLDKAHKRMLEALMDGTLSVDDVRPEYAPLLARALEKEASNDQKYFRDQSRRRLAVKHPVKTSLAGMKVFASCDLGSDIAAFHAALRRAGAREVSSRVDADAIVVEDVACPGQRNTLMAHLCGLLLCTPAFVMDGAGPSLRFVMAVAKKKQVWASERFIAQHPIVHDILRAAAARPGSRWTWIDSKEKLLEQSKKRKASGNASEIVAFVTPREQKAEELPARAAGF